jgi:hypothetical protein
VGDFPFGFDTDLSDVGHWLDGGPHDEAERPLQKSIPVHGHANLFEGVDGGDLEVEAGIIRDDIAQFREEGGDPIGPIGPDQILDLLNGCCPNRKNSIFEIVEEQWFQVFDK